MNKKEKILSSLALIATVSLLMFCIFILPQAGKVNGSGFVESTCDTSNNFSGFVASSSLVSLPTASASSTLTCSFPTSQSDDLNLAVVASSTSSVVQYDVAFSNNDVDWYYQTSLNASSTVLSSTANLYRYAPGTTATSSVNQTIATNGSRYIQIRFKGTGAASMIYGQIVAKNVIPN